MYPLGSRDKKILTMLSVDARATYAEIGKKTRLHKDTVAYRIKKLEEEGIITGYTTFFDFSRLSTRVYKIYIKFKGLKEGERQLLLSFLKKEKCVGWIVEGNGSWDMIVGFHTHSVKRFYDFKLAFEAQFHEKIQTLNTTTQIQAYLYPRDSLVSSAREEIALYSSDAPLLIDLKDRAILQELAKNARASVIDIARTTRLSARTVAYRIKQL